MIGRPFDLNQEAERVRVLVLERVRLAARSSMAAGLLEEVGVRVAADLLADQLVVFLEAQAVGMGGKRVRFKWPATWVDALWERLRALPVGSWWRELYRRPLRWWGRRHLVMYAEESVQVYRAVCPHLGGWLRQGTGPHLAYLADHRDHLLPTPTTADGQPVASGHVEAGHQALAELDAWIAYRRTRLDLDHLAGQPEELDQARQEQERALAAVLLEANGGKPLAEDRTLPLHDRRQLVEEVAMIVGRARSWAGVA